MSRKDNQGNIDNPMQEVRTDLPDQAAQPARSDSVFNSGLSIDEIMARVRAEVARRRNGQSDVSSHMLATSSSSSEGSVPRWRPAVPRLPFKRDYWLAELIGFSDADFIDVAYRTVLRRPPDERGFNESLEQLRSGAATKVEILWSLRESPEGRDRGVIIHGLRQPYLLHKWRRKPFVGPIIGWIHAFLRLGTVNERRAVLDAIQARESQEAGRLLNEVSDHLMRRITTLETELAVRTPATAFEELKVEHNATATQLGQLEAHLARELARRPDNTAFARLQEEHVAKLNFALAASDATLAKLKEEHARTLARVAALETDLARELAARPGSAGVMKLAEMDASVLTKLRAEDQSLESSINLSVAAAIQPFLENERRAKEDARALDSFYAAFEHRFRGDRALVRARVEPYLELVREAGAGTAEAPVVDVGCGRGEWLELLRDHGLIGQGIDNNRVFIEMCRGRGLQIIEGDAIESLRAMPESSVGAVTSIHVVEHLPFELVVALLDEARRVLRPGGLLILETPNPENLSVGLHLFYTDPTHRSPLPPEGLRFIVEERGFQDTRIERLTLARDLNVPPPVPEEVPGAASINALLALLNASADYAVVATRP